LARCVAEPAAVFFLLGKELRQMGRLSLLPESFMRCRLGAQTQARRKHGDRSTLALEYEELAVMLRWPPELRDQVMSMELELEAALMQPIPGAKDKVASARKAGSKIRFLSDMYLPEAFLRAQLRRHGLYEDGDRCYISCEEGASKGSGSLFRRLMEAEGLSPGAVEHHGNDPWSDAAMPEKLGLRVDPFPQGNANRYERLLEQHRVSSGGVSSLLGGASRLARLGGAAKDAREACLAEVAAGVAAPVLASFVLWILVRARELGLRRLYFVSRDGFVLLRLARPLAAALNIPVELRYLYGGRQAWYLPMLERIDETALAEWMLCRVDILPVRPTLFRVGLTPEEVRDKLLAAGIREEDWSNDNVDAGSRLRRVFEDPAVQSLILRRAAENKGRFIRYLRQEGLFDNVPSGFVDLGWNGHLEDRLNQAVMEEGGTPPIALYFGLHKNAVTCRLGARETFLLGKDIGIDPLGDFYCIEYVMESFCPADHGMVTGYQEGVQGVAPRFLSERNAPVERWGLPVFLETLDRFSRVLSSKTRWIDLCADMRPVSAALLREFWLAPSPQEARLWGTFPFDADMDGHKHRPLAWAYRVTELPGLLLKGWSWNARPWGSGSIAQSGRIVRWGLVATFGVRRIMLEVLQEIRDRVRYNRLFRLILRHLRCRPAG